eukprot:575478-Amphidinium_carterae.2
MVVQHFGEEAAKDDVNMESENDINDFKKLDFTKLLNYLRQFLRPLLSLGRLCDDWRRRPVQGTLPC